MILKDSEGSDEKGMKPEGAPCGSDENQLSGFSALMLTLPLSMSTEATSGDRRTGHERRSGDRRALSREAPAPE